MNLAERGAYRDLLDYHYAEGSIPADPKTLAGLLAVSQSELEAVWPTVSQKFKPHPSKPERLVNAKANEVIAETEAYRRQQSANGSKGGRPRKKKGSEPKPTRNPSLSFGKANQNHEEEELHIVRRSSNGAYPSWFEEFWSRYPSSKGSKKAAFEKACKALKSDKDIRLAMDYLNVRAAHIAALKTSGKFVENLPHVERYFSKGLWNERLEIQPEKGDGFRRAWE